jgi:cysteinyl-tRNA synthetase
MRLYNTLSREVEDFKPIDDKKVRLYSCGLTVYSQPQIGNWSAYVYWDILVRTLRHLNYEVTHVQNITDVGHLTSDEDSGEDKMEKGARLEKTTAWEVAEKYIKIANHEAYGLLKLARPNKLIRATDYIKQQIEFTKKLEQAGFTYEIDDDGLYFDTSKLDDYGKLARLDLKGLRAGERVPHKGKKNATDFAVWKFSPKNQKRDMEWDSPWGKGFPGWHLECSVMAYELLGEQIDIHTGGVDHIPVHHTNEIAQTESVTGKKFSKYWLHCNHIKVDGKKMAKSEGNIYYLQDLVDKGFDLEAYKLLVISKHYRTEGNFTWDILSSAQNRINKFRALSDIQFQYRNDAGGINTEVFEGFKKNIVSSLKEDLNTPKAVAAVDEFLEKINANAHMLNQQDSVKLKEALELINQLLGLDLASREDISPKQKQLLQTRAEARTNNDWSKSDFIRVELEEQGIGLNDTPNGQIWFRHK